MKRQFKYSLAVERYLSNDMEYAEKKIFEKEILVNPDLASEYQLSVNINKALFNDDLLDFRKKLLQARQEYKQKKSDLPILRLKKTRIWYAAASLLVLLTAGSIWIFIAGGMSSNETLFRKYYSPESMVNVTRSGDANMIEAVIQFQEKNYEMAASMFKPILVNDPQNYSAWFYFGISCIEMAAFTEAENAFKNIIKNDSNLYIEHAEWFLGLTYLKSDQPKKAKEQLDRVVSNPDNIHRLDARNLLKKLSE